MNSAKKLSKSDFASIPKPGSGTFKSTNVRKFLFEQGWECYFVDGKLRWVDPWRPYELSFSEEEALSLAMKRSAET